MAKQLLVNKPVPDRNSKAKSTQKKRTISDYNATKQYILIPVAIDVTLRWINYELEAID